MHPPSASPFFCEPAYLVDGVSAQIRSGHDNDGEQLVFGRIGSHESTPTDTGITSSLALARSFAPASSQSGFVRAFIQTREYPSLATKQTAALRGAAALQGVCRTGRAWVDRTRLRISFQVKDDLGSPLVNEHSYSGVRLLVTNGSLSIDVLCGSMPSPTHFYLGHCSVTDADQAWFAGKGTIAEVSIQATLAEKAANISAALGSIQFVGQPAWYDPLLRSTSATTERAAPPGFNETVGLFITLPSSPVYAGGASGETLFANVYINTRGFVANAWRLKIFFNTSVLDFISAEVRSDGPTAATLGACAASALPAHRRLLCRTQASSIFNEPVVTSSRDGVSFSSTGLACDTECTPMQTMQAKGDVIYLMRAELAVHAGIPAAAYDGESLNLHPFAFEVLNYAGNRIYEMQVGMSYDARDTIESFGQVVVQATSTAGIFAFPPTVRQPQAVLPNTAALTGDNVAYATSVVAVTTYDNVDAGTLVEKDVSESGALACDFEALPPGVLSSFANCEVQMSPAETSSASRLNMTVNYTDARASFTRQVTLGVHAFAHIVLSANDTTLNRYKAPDGTLGSNCSNGSSTYFPY